MKTQSTIFQFSGLKKSFSLFFAVLIACLLTFTTVKAVDGPVEKSTVEEYLIGHGITPVAINTIPDTYDWISTNSDRTYTRVFVDEGVIVGHENIDY